MNKPRTILDLKENIHQEIAAMPEDILQRVFANLEHGVQF
jgi:hypothetical protein